jgi:hypothetical protein
MKPGIAQIALGAANTLAAGVAPHLASPYAVGHAGTVAMLLIFMAQEAERAAETLAGENAALRALFAEAAPKLEWLRERLADASAGREESLHVSILEAENARLRTLLIELHAAAEAADLHDVEAQIWRVLKKSADDRSLVLPVPL